MISIIVAACEDNVIGKDNRLLWRLSGDLKFFKSTTYGHPLIMGRKTFESIGKPLPGRTIIAVSRQSEYAHEGVIVVSSLEDAVKKANELDEEIFIAGGGEIYRQALSLADRIYFTKVNAKYEGDTFFPKLSGEDWLLINQEDHLADDKNEHDYSLLVYERRR